MNTEDHLHELRSSILRLHHALLDVERKNFEKVSGRLSSGQLLQLVINHAHFAWLRIISELVVQIDEALSGDESVTELEIKELLAQAQRLFNSPADEEFMRKYQAALQREPAVVVAHSEVMKLLRAGNSASTV